MILGNKFHWVAKYSDGNELQQVEASGKKNSYSDIDRDKLSGFEMWEAGRRLIYISFAKGQRLIWRRRVETSPGGTIEVCHIIGKQEQINGKNYQGIVGLFESDGRIEIAGKFEEGHPWFSPVSIHANEGEVWEEEK
jgi:hypothetical protein